ncbi:MAG: PEP-CTERM sorting domain-containing protein, partial [Opitutales bacterium]
SNQPNGNVVEFELPFYFGQAFDFGFELRTYASVQINPDPIIYPGSDTRAAGAIAQAKFGNTAEIFITGVSTELGGEIPFGAFGLNSGSGFDYGVVPEPSSSALIFGLIATVFVFRRRRRQTG